MSKPVSKKKGYIYINFVSNLQTVIKFPLKKKEKNTCLHNCRQPLNPLPLLQLMIYLNVYIVCRTVRNVSHSGKKIEYIFRVV